MSPHHRLRAPAVLALLLSLVARPGATQILETETARFLRARTLEIGTGFEHQTSGEGVERAVPLAGEYGITDRLSLLVEPVVYTAIRPKQGARATGAGDLEVTLLGLLREETRRWPAFAAALEVKAPTAKNELIGTGKTDVAGYLIASRRFGRLDTHANVSYTILGKPAGVEIHDVWGGAIAAEMPLRGPLGLFGEVLANTSSTPEGSDSSGPIGAVIPELVGGETVGTLGLSLRTSPGFLFSLGVSYDNNSAWMFRPGLTWRGH